jgi:hypothetical protein
MSKTVAALLAVVFAAVAVYGAQAGASSGPCATYNPQIPSGGHFSKAIDNPYFPLPVGRTFVYRGAENGKKELDRMHVTRRTKLIAGITATVVSDNVYEPIGKAAEKTLDYYAQDDRGNVWYLGEDTKELDRHGRVTSTEGSWRAGVHGARQGVIMPAHPRAGQQFQQEFLAGHAEDRFRVVAANSAGVATREFTPLEPGVIDRKWYAYGIGNIREKTLRGPRESADLVEFSRGT